MDKIKGLIIINKVINLIRPNGDRIKNRLIIRSLLRIVNKPVAR